jgi:hypothetical protein
MKTPDCHKPLRRSFPTTVFSFRSSLPRQIHGEGVDVFAVSTPATFPDLRLDLPHSERKHSET